jgi:hypothetical protein
MFRKKTTKFVMRNSFKILTMKKTILTLIVVATVLLLTFSQCKKDSCVENPKKDCLINFVNSPVCGCNGKTYGNASRAHCAGIEVVKEGRCK